MTTAGPSKSGVSVAERSAAAPGVIFTKLRWPVEIGLILGFYLVYSWVRNRFGSNASDARQAALDNALDIVAAEEKLWLYLEPGIQDFFIDATWFIQFWNLFYGTFHFVVTGGALLFLFLRFPADYARWRTAGMATTAMALFGFALYPLMPPRLLGNCETYGGCIADSPFIDTVADVGGLWSFDSGTMAQVSNQYAAMPSLHCGWALWCALVFFPRVKNPIGRLLVVLYPIATVFAVVVTANHYWLDALGGYVVVGLGYGFARAVEQIGARLPNAFAGPDDAVAR